LLQVMLVILAELDGNTEEEIYCVETVVKKLLEMMNFSEISRQGEWKRNEGSEMALVVLRMLSILVSRWRGSEQKTESSWIARVTAETIQRSGIVSYCKELLHMLRSTWKGQPEEPDPTSSLGAASVPAPVLPDTLGTALLKPYPLTNPPDFSPFFLKQYIKTHSNDILEELSLLLSEMALRLPYQIKKVLTQQSIFDTVRLTFQTFYFLKLYTHLNIYFNRNGRNFCAKCCKIEMRLLFDAKLESCS
jgi:E3 ubiquitin-protein ligase UBR4